MKRSDTEEYKRLNETKDGPVASWEKWGPYVAERSWGTVREDYSENGDAWNFFPYDLARQKTYRWGEDGIAGWCDRYQILTFAPAFWNEKDPFLKERLFGLNAWEGNHGEDVKEYYYYLDATPSHSYMKYLYKYPQQEFPYNHLKEANQNRGTHVAEYELIDTGIFNENRYFDIFIEYAKADSEDTCIRIEAHNRGDEDAPLHIIPHLWFRNQWSWQEEEGAKPEICNADSSKEFAALVADEKEMASPANLSFEYRLGKRYLYGPAGGHSLFTNNESPWFEGTKFGKDAFHKAIVNGENCCNSEGKGTKACIHYYYVVPAKGSVILNLRLTNQKMTDPLKDIQKVIDLRKKEADTFYQAIQPALASEEEKKIQRSAIAGILWNKQFYYYDVSLWIKGDRYHPRPQGIKYTIRNTHWRHLNSMRILCMPDKWEYPWFAAWDHAFHCLTLGLVDIECAKDQLWLLLFDQFQHPNGQIPAYEWEFSDLNPPVQAWALLTLLKIEEDQKGQKDLAFLEKCYHKLLMNFAWWVNKVDNQGYNVFEGGFLGLDNITFIDRSVKLMGDVRLEQSDGTGWMAIFCLSLMRIGLELSKKDPAYESLATKFFQHFVYISHAMKIRDEHNYELWDEQDGFFYDLFRYPDNAFMKCRVRSLVGLIPLFAVETISQDELEHYPEFAKNFHWFRKNKSVYTNECIFPMHENKKEFFLLSIVNQKQLQRSLEYVWNPNEFRSNFGLRSLSRFHESHPYFHDDRSVSYEPWESLHKIKGGNSNWRGPIWFPTSFLFIDALKKFAKAFGNSIKIQVENEEPVSLEAISIYFANRMIALFAKDSTGKRPYFGDGFPYNEDKHWTDHIQFYEYFNPETGKGLGASHQTGWSALVANLIQEFKSKKI